MLMLEDAVKYAIGSQRTRLSGAARPKARPVQMRMPVSTELSIKIEQSQPIHGRCSVMIGSIPQRFVKAFGMVDIGSRSQNPQYWPPGDASTTFPPPEPLTDALQDIRNRENKDNMPKPLKMIALFGCQKFPRDRETWPVIIYSGSSLSVRT
jgi:hypothetical protein